MTPRPAPKSKKLLFILLGLGAFFGCLAFGALAAITVPNFKSYRQRSRQAEAKMTLRVLLTQEEEFRAREGVWATSPRQLVEYANSGPQNFTCFLSPSGAWGGKGQKVAFEQ